MNEYQASKKIDGGKLLCIKLKANETIQRIQILGDFFLHPEDAIFHVEQRVIGLPVTTPFNTLESEISIAFTEKRANLIGASTDDIAELILEALKSPIDENRFAESQ